MTSEAGICLGVLCGGTMTVVAVNFVPPLTQSSGEAFQQRQSAAQTRDINSFAYCQAQLPDVNCQCFSNVVTQVLADDSPRVQGWTYADKWELARSQATGTC